MSDDRVVVAVPVAVGDAVGLAAVTTPERNAIPEPAPSAATPPPPPETRRIAGISADSPFARIEYGMKHYRVREILGAGTWFGLPVLPAAWPGWGILLLPPGAFLTLGLLLGLAEWTGQSKSSRKSASHVV